MDSLTLDDIDGLFGSRPGWCVSIYIPTHRTGRALREDPIRLKNRVAEAKIQLQDGGAEESVINAILDPIRRRFEGDAPESSEFWLHQADGLAVFSSAEGMQEFRIPESFDELTVVAHRFHVKPLLQAVQQDGQYCLLAVSQNQVRFLEGSRARLAARAVESLPKSLQELFGGDHQEGFDLHSVRAARGDGQSAISHGHADTDQHDDLTRYFRTISSGLHEALESDRRPLLFAGVEELFPYLKETTSYANLCETPVLGNPDDASDSDLHERAWPIVEELIAEQQAEPVRAAQAAAHTEMGGTSLAEIVCAAGDGRVETLVLRAGQQCWGMYDEESREVTVEDAASPDNYDLLDLAAVRTLRCDGRVVISDTDIGAGDSPVTAIYRYAAATT